MKSILQAIYYTHQNEIVHRDIKHANVLVSRKDGEIGDVKITDFGLSVNFETEEACFKILKGANGTIVYMAPEQAESMYSTAVDIWSCGMILYNLIDKGKHP